MLSYNSDVTAVCILEGFQNGVTLQSADRVLKELGKSKAKEALQVRYHNKVLAHKAPPIIYSRRQFQILLLFKNYK